jgi:hypothetical protein
VHSEQCDQKNSDYKCREITVDPDAERKKITELLKSSTVLDWFNDKKFADTGIDTETLKKTFIDKYVEYGAKYGCSPVFYQTDKHPLQNTVIPKVILNGKDATAQKMLIEKMESDLDKPENIKLIDEKITERNQKSFYDEKYNKFSVCSKLPVKVEPKSIAAILNPTCAANLKSFYADNQFEFTIEELQKIGSSPEAEQLSKCIKDHLDKGAKIDHIDITTSASTLNNTWKKLGDFCEKDFKGLSTARANSAKAQILPQLFSKSGFSLGAEKVEINPLGTNGDGTSGPCAHEDSGVLKEKYKDPKVKATLDAHKSVNIQVTFTDSLTKVQSPELYIQPLHPCRTIVLKCEPKSTSK